MAGDGSPAARNVGAQTHDVTERATAGLVEESLAARLRTVLPHLLGPAVWERGVRDTAVGRGGAGDLVDAAARHVCADPSPDKLWLVLAAAAARLPSAEDVHEAAYRAETSSPAQMALWLLEHASRRSTPAGLVRRIRLADDHVLVDAGARSDSDSRSALADFDRLVDVVTARWEQKDRYLRVAWDCAFGCWTAGADLVVPWKTTVVVLGTTALEARDPLAAAGELSGSTFVALADDNFPAASAGLIPDARVARIVAHLSVLKHFSRVATLSEASAADYRGYVSAMSAQGLVGPEVIVCPLATEPLVASGSRVGRASMPSPSKSDRGGNPGSPVILFLGNIDGRSNLDSLLCAAERLWSEGARFELAVAADGAPDRQCLSLLAYLAAKGRRVALRSAVTAGEVSDLFRSSRFVVSPSSHEGTALTISESLARGVPVLCSKQAASTDPSWPAGVLSVDTTDEAALSAVIRRLLGDDLLVSELREQLERRQPLPWSEAADGMWDLLVRGGRPGGLEQGQEVRA